MNQMDGREIKAQLDPLMKCLTGLVGTLERDFKKAIAGASDEQKIEMAKQMKDSGVEEKAKEMVKQLKDLNNEPNLE